MNISPAIIKRRVVNFIYRFHVMIFVVVALGGMIAATLVLSNIVAKADQTDSNLSAGSSANFDQETIDRINQLKTPGEASGSELELPSGRTNPFIE